MNDTNEIFAILLELPCYQFELCHLNAHIPPKKHNLAVLNGHLELSITMSKNLIENRDSKSAVLTDQTVHCLCSKFHNFPASRSTGCHRLNSERRRRKKLMDTICASHLRCLPPNYYYYNVNCILQNNALYSNKEEAC